MGKSQTFDLTTHHRDMKTGLISHTNAYRLVASKIFGDIYERPIGSGLCYFADGTKAPTSAEIQKLSDEAAKKTPRKLTMADLDEIRKGAREDAKEEIEDTLRAKLELEWQGRINDVVAARLSEVLPKLNITGENAEKVTEAVLPNVSISEPTGSNEITEIEPVTSSSDIKVDTVGIPENSVSKPFKPAVQDDPAPVA